MKLFHINLLNPDETNLPDQTWIGWSYPRGEKPSLRPPLPEPQIRIGYTARPASAIPNYVAMNSETAASRPSVVLPSPFWLAVFVDVATGKDAEFNRWYDDEHMPRLTGVEGVSGALRYRRAEGIDGEDFPDEPRATQYLAVYAVTDPAIIDSPAWTTAAATDWTLELRPHFLRSDRYLLQQA